LLSNELNTPKILSCPSDERYAHTNFDVGPDFAIQPRTFQDLYLSYFLGRDADETQPQMFLSGDRNIYGPASLPTANNGFGMVPSASSRLRSHEHPRRRHDAGLDRQDAPEERQRVPLGRQRAAVHVGQAARATAPDGRHDLVAGTEHLPVPVSRVARRFTKAPARAPFLFYLARVEGAQRVAGCEAGEGAVAPAFESEERVVRPLFRDGRERAVPRAEQRFGRQRENLLAHLLPRQVPGLVPASIEPAKMASPTMATCGASSGQLPTR